MIVEVVYTETYKFTLTAIVDNLEKAYGVTSAEKLLDRIDRIIGKIVVNPYLYQAIPVDTPFRRAVISGSRH